jgi:1,4-dihydroxy-2-naphthoyl-CoA hydrolase
MSDARLEALSASMPVARLVGLTVTRAGKCCVCATVTDEHCTAGGTAHGGFLTTQSQFNL